MTGFCNTPVAKNLPTNAGAQVWPLVREDSACHGAQEPLSHSGCACALESIAHNKENHHSEESADGNAEQPLLATARESPPAAVKVQHRQEQ